MEVDKIPPHRSADEHAHLQAEEQLLKDGGQWLKRAADLYTQTPKIKIWVPAVCSMLLTTYYLFNMHGRTAATASLPAAQSNPPAAVVVVDDAPLPNKRTSGDGPGERAGVVTEVPAADASEADLLLQAQQAHGNSQFADEAMLLQKVAEHARSWQAVCPEIGKAYERAGAMDSAIKSFDHCAALAPNDVDTLLAFAHTLVAKPDYARASALYRRCIQTDPQNLDAKTGLALIDLRENRLREADQTARLVLSKAPNNTDALLITGIVAWRESRLTDAEQIFSKGAAIDDRRADFHAFLGRIAEAQLRPQVALQQYEKALALDPGDSEISDRRDRLRAGK